jgi:hypothetical protein
MATDQSTSFLLSDEDRRDFGNWLSGFVDGEGCFRLVSFGIRKKPSLIAAGAAEFIINLRLDDMAVLEKIHAYFGCGQVRVNLNRRPSMRRNTKPQGRFVVSTVRDHARVIVPHFEQFPLQAKKARDFAIWKEAVALLERMRRKPRVARRGHGGAGAAPKWSQAEADEFNRLDAELKAVRVYDGPSWNDPNGPPPIRQPLLF